MPWQEFLSEEDWTFVKRFLLHSGSLKAIAAEYGVSYPTVRLRLDRLIAKLQVADSLEPMSAFERLLRTHYADGKLDLPTLKLLLDAHRVEMRGPHAPPNSP